MEFINDLMADVGPIFRVLVLVALVATMSSDSPYKDDNKKYKR